MTGVNSPVERSLPEEEEGDPVFSALEEAIDTLVSSMMDVANVNGIPDVEALRPVFRDSLAATVAKLLKEHGCE